MIVIKTADFERAFRKLPLDIQRFCRIQEERLRNDPDDPRLHQKQLRESDKVYSLRVTRRYRILYPVRSRTPMACRGDERNF